MTDVSGLVDTLDPLYSVSAFFVGVIVRVSGGALMTPLLVLAFGDPRRRRDLSPGAVQERVAGRRLRAPGKGAGGGQSAALG